MPDLLDPPAHEGTTVLRRPRLSDSIRMQQIAKDSRVLDVNSAYAYLLWCRDFPNTSAVAEIDGRVAGYVTGYVRPESPDTLFIWQVAVDEAARGRGVGVAMLDRILDWTRGFGVRFLETTITADNPSSIAMFTALARRRDTGIYARPLFAADHFPEGHAAEDLYTIGPIHGGGRR
ncbi:diaminobutyrate acetyltransferase [Rhodococcus sp. NPDC058505]|uniref:diaminobutyrate acetyltransferase n=1 Tax=unclassified Rhodococcus (in: high G+C Gram-positive bacteria) TaxID=192944 RepID=UPI0036531492